MGLEIIIGISITVAMAVLFGIHSWLHHLVKFKMDESAIVKLLEGTGDNHSFRSTKAISADTDISVGRVTIVCNKSKAIKRNSEEKESWCLK